MRSLQRDVGGFPRLMGAVGGLVFFFFGTWAIVAPSAFYRSIAFFEPYNAHFVQDIGAFQLGLGATLLLATFVTSDALAAGLIGVGLGAAAHVLSHLLSLDGGGNPGLDIPILSILGVLLLVAGGVRWRTLRESGRR